MLHLIKFSLTKLGYFDLNQHLSLTHLRKCVQTSYLEYFIIIIIIIIIQICSIF